MSRNKIIILAGVTVLVVILAVSSQYSLEIGRFFANPPSCGDLWSGGGYPDGCCADIAANADYCRSKGYTVNLGPTSGGGDNCAAGCFAKPKSGQSSPDDKPDDTVDKPTDSSRACVFDTRFNAPEGAWFCQNLKCQLDGNPSGGQEFPPEGPAVRLNVKIHGTSSEAVDTSDGPIHIRTVLDATPKCANGKECYPPKDPLWSCTGPMYQGRYGHDFYDCYNPIIHRVNYGPITCCAGTGLSGDCFTWDSAGTSGQPPASAPQPFFRVDGKTSSTRRQLETFAFTGTKYSPGGEVTRYLKAPNAAEVVLSPTLKASSIGNISWSFTPGCSAALGTYSVYTIDKGSGIKTPPVTVVVNSNPECAAQPPPPPPSGTTGPAAGVLTAQCSGGTTPNILVKWSKSPPPGSTGQLNAGNPAVINKTTGTSSVQLDPPAIDRSTYWEWNDTALSSGQTYAYTGKYGPNVATNTVTLVATSANCAGTVPPPPPPGPPPPPPPQGSITPDQLGLKEGDIIRAENDQDIYIINQKGYKRLFLNEMIFGFYGHLGGYQNVKSVPRSTRDAFVTSGLFKNCETMDNKVWALEVTGSDSGRLHEVQVSQSTALAADPGWLDRQFCINNNELGWYPKGLPYTSLSQIPRY